MITFIRTQEFKARDDADNQLFKWVLVGGLGLKNSDPGSFLSQWVMAGFWRTWVAQLVNYVGTTAMPHQPWTPAHRHPLINLKREQGTPVRLAAPAGELCVCMVRGGAEQSLH